MALGSHQLKEQEDLWAEHEDSLGQKEIFLLHRDDFVEDRFGKIIASFLSILSGESMIHLLYFECSSDTFVYRLSLENKLGYTCLASRHSKVKWTLPPPSICAAQDKLFVLEGWIAGIPASSRIHLCNTDRHLCCGLRLLHGSSVTFPLIRDSVAGDCSRGVEWVFSARCEN